MKRIEKGEGKYLQATEPETVRQEVEANVSRKTLGRW